MKIKNLIAAAYAPLKEDLSLNLNIIPSYSSFLQRNKVAGVFINGSTGDFTSLSIAERKEITEAWAKESSTDFFVINHVGHTSLDIAKDLAAHSAGKVDAIATLAPYYFKTRSLQCLVDYCKEIAASAPDLPFYYYHIPGLTGADYNMVDFLALAKDQIPSLEGIKFTNNNVIDFSYSKDAEDEKYNILYGVDEMFLSGLPYGATGWVGSTYNHAAPLYYAIKEAFDLGDHQLARSLQTKSAQFVDTLNAMGGFNGAAKSFMKTLGVDCGPSRFPHTTLSNMQLEQATKELKALEILEHLSK